MKILLKQKQILPEIKISFKQLFIISLYAISTILIVQLTEVKTPHKKKEMMLIAANKMVEAENILSKYRITNNIKIDLQHDPLLSGFIGIEFSPITTTLGDLQAKQTSTNPDFAALFVRWFDELELKKGDKIIIHLSGSFPALSIASIIASEVYGLTPIIISSIGASSFGANIPSLTYWDIETLLFSKNIIHHKTIYATPGGQDDNGSSFWENGFEIMLNAAKKNSLHINTPSNLSEAITKKLEFINSQKPFKLFINIGGNQAALGIIPCSMQLPHGLIKNILKCNCPSDCFGLIHIINRNKTPIIHILNIKDLALENGIDLTPYKNYKLGESDLYFTKKKSRLIITLLLIVLVASIVYITIYKKLD